MEVLCDRVGIILGGRLRDVGRLGDLLSPRVQSIEATLCVPPPARNALARASLLAEHGDQLDVTFPDEPAAEEAIRIVLAAGGRVVALTPHRETLEDFFVRRLEETRSREGEGGLRARGG